MRSDYAYQDAIRRDFRNKVTAVIAVALLAFVLSGVVEESSLLPRAGQTAAEQATTGPTALEIIR